MCFLYMHYADNVFTFNEVCILHISKNDHEVRKNHYIIKNCSYNQLYKLAVEIICPEIIVY